jgi:hypothetical protein
MISLRDTLVRCESSCTVELKQAVDDDTCLNCPGSPAAAAAAGNDSELMSLASWTCYVSASMMCVLAQLLCIDYTAIDYISVQ